MKFANCHPDREHRAKGLCDNCYTNQWYHSHPVQKALKNFRYRLKHGQIKTWTDKKEMRRALSLRPRNREYYNQKHREWNKKNRAKINADTRLYRLRKMKACPQWLTKGQIQEMKQFYVNCPENYHVDHIYPLKGIGSCGLHVPWNLQYLLANDNRRKSNRLPLDRCTILCYNPPIVLFNTKEK